MIVVPPSALLGYVSFSGLSDSTPTWSPTTTYNIGDIVKDIVSNRLHKSLISSNLNHAPPFDGTSTTQWQDIGPTNVTQCIDYTTNKQSVSDTGLSLSVTLASNQLFRVDTIGVFNIDANTVNVTVKLIDGVTVVYNKTETLFSRTIGDWYDYFYKSFRFRRAALFEDLPQSLTYQYHVTVDAGAGKAKCGAIVMGQGVYLGTTSYDPTVSTINYSTISADAFGNTTLIARRSVPNNTVTTQIPAAAVDDALAVKDTLNAVAALWSGLDDDTQPYFGSLLLFGVYTQFDIDPFSIDYATVTLQLQGL
jgi:hypothetical protein